MSALLEKLGVKEKPRTASEIIKKLLGHLGVLESESKGREKALETVPKYLASLKSLLVGGDVGTKEEVLIIAKEACNTDLLLLLVKHITALEFEARKDAAAVFSCIVRIHDEGDKSPGRAYILSSPSRTAILDLLFAGYDEPSVALNTGSMLRDCIRDEALARVVLAGPMAMAFFTKLDVSNFEISSDAFATFKDLMLRHKSLVAQYLMEQYSEFFPAYMKLLQSKNYVTRRLSLKLLGEILLGRSNVKVMVRFVAEPAYLMQMMMLLKDESHNIQFEAYHVFKVFVCNPAKPQAINDILTKNRDKLLKYFEEFQTERDGDEQFKEEKALIIKEISMLGAAGAAAAEQPRAATALEPVSGPTSGDLVKQVSAEP